MGEENQTYVNEFVFLGLSQDPETQVLLFFVFLIIYLLTVLGNLLIIVLIHIDSRLHTPMYFFFRNLSFAGLCFSTATVPQVLIHLLVKRKTIPFAGCSTQIVVLLLVGGTECALLAVMSCDWYVAVCKPLHYSTIMTHWVCSLLAHGATSWILAFQSALGHAIYTMHFPFCLSWEISHLLWEILRLLKLACADTSRYELIIYVTGVTFLLLPISAIVASYILILFTVLHIPSNEGRKKALVTCSSHLTVVGMFYGAATFMYVLPSSFHSPKQDNIISVFYTIVTPALNPLKRVLGKYRLLAHSTL
uniref:G-protein coupled receptors family 1 profile domain-containing protein n=1 Tax=Piliocolobus tephrosceles TaxID=591936 RepID=A0A8C9G863_9PRIM